MNFDELALNVREVMLEVCEFLEVSFGQSCLKPTVLGVLTKGNSSLAKLIRIVGKYIKICSIKNFLILICRKVTLNTDPSSKS